MAKNRSKTSSNKMMNYKRCQKTRLIEQAVYRDCIKKSILKRISEVEYITCRIFKLQNLNILNFCKKTPCFIMVKAGLPLYLKIPGI